MKKNKYSKIGRVLCCAILTVCITGSSQNAYAVSNLWELSTDGWKVRAAETGNYVTSQWLSMDGKWYYLDDAGIMLTGWQYVNDIWYYFWPNGAMAVGWVLLEECGKGNWYYFEQSGAMVTGWKEIAGCWYYFEASGVMAADTITSDGYRVNANGAWIPDEKITISAIHPSTGGHSSGGGASSNYSDKEQPDSPKDKESDNKESDTAIPAPKPPGQADEEPVASDSNADLDQYLQAGMLLKENNQVEMDEVIRVAISQKHRRVIFLSNESYPYSQKLNRMEYKEIQKFGLTRKQIIAEDKIYYITIYQLEYADTHENVVKEYQASSCQRWGYTISKCNECGEVMDKVYLPPTGHDYTDSDLFCDSCGVLAECGIDSKQKVRTGLTKPYDTLELTCIDDNYSGGMLFLSDTVVPYQAGVWFDGTSNNYTWSDARNWLNLNFYNGLSVAKYIRPIDLPDIEDNLPDKVFCLSKDEILSYAEWSMSPWSEPDSRFYWSRTAESSGYAYAVHYTGHIASEVIDSTVSGIRPAYVIPKPKNETIPSPIWLKGAKQLRRNNGEEHIFTCANPDYRSAGGKRGALFYTDTCVSTAEAAAQWMEKMENQHGILAFEAYTDEEGIHPGFLAEQK